MSGFHRPHILIVSDDLDLSQFLQEGLVYAGFFTSTVASAFQALELFRLRTFDAVLVDSLLEGLGAEHLVTRLRELNPDDGNPRTDVPVLVLAGSANELTWDQANKMGADDVIYAPIEIEDLAVLLFGRIGAWRTANQDRPWADVAAQHSD
jgi:DNA-binding response OmpR family regulator